MPIDSALAVLAFSAGMASFFSPCAAALLPAYASLYMGSSEPVRSWKRLFKGAYFGLQATLGFIAVYVSAGIVISLLGSAVSRFIPYLGFLAGLMLIAVGALMALGKDMFLSIPNVSNSEMNSRSVFGYGVVFAITSLGCTLPIFLAVVTFSIASGGVVNGIITFLLYSLGKGLLMVLFTTLLAVSKEGMMAFMRSFSALVRRITPYVLVAAGGYIIFYYLAVLKPF